MQYLRLHYYGVTGVDAEGASGKVKMVINIIKRLDPPPHVEGSLNSSPWMPFILLIKLNPLARAYFRKTGFRGPLFFHGSTPSVFTGKENEMICESIMSFM